MIAAIFLLGIAGLIVTAAAGGFWLFRVLWRIESEK